LWCFFLSQCFLKEETELDFHIGESQSTRDLCCIP
jgi:hypothetical protein